MAQIILISLLPSLVGAWDADNIESIKEYIIYSAQHEKVDVLLALSIAKCESKFNKDALHNSEKEHSIGVFQINLKAHKDITEEEAYNPFKNVNWAIDQMAQGKWSMWTCWKPSNSQIAHADSSSNI